MTYLLSIANAYERINFAWIKNCISSGKLLPRKNYALQVGFSQELNRDIEPHETVGMDLRKMFKDDHFVVAILFGYLKHK